MVLLVISLPAIESIKLVLDAVRIREQGTPEQELLDRLGHVQVNNRVQHSDLVHFSQLVKKHKDIGDELIEGCRLDTLLKGASVYHTPPPPKTEPTPEYKALMKRLREQEEQKQYERMINPLPANEVFRQKVPTTGIAFNPATSHGQVAPEDIDEVTYADVNRQLTLIINILISIICCSVAIWIAARRWSVPQRLALSMSGSGLVAVAEVAIYMGYIRRIKESKDKERKVVEKRDIIESWTIKKESNTAKDPANDSIRYRKGRHR